LLCPLAHFFMMGNMHNHNNPLVQQHDPSAHDKTTTHSP
jgi:hypothetical protein